MKRARHLLQSSVIVILLFGLGKITGLVRVRLISNTFGLDPVFDAFTAANQLPELFFTLIAGGSLAAAFIPVYSNYLNNKSARESAALANTILTMVLAVLGAIALLGIAFAPWLTRVVLVPDFLPDLQETTAVIMQIILIQTVIFGISGTFSSILNAHQHFALPALAPLALDVGYMVGLYFFVPRWGIYGLAWGTVVGAILHLAIQTPALWKYKIGYRPAWKVKMAGTREIIILMGPRLIALGAIQFADLFIIRLASGLPSGSTSAYFYGYALMQLPETLFGTAVALVVFPTLSELYNAGDMDGLRKTAVTALRTIWTLTIPAAAALVLLGEEAISFLLEGGAFTADSTRLVYTVLLAFSIRVVSEATLEIAARLFYAQHNTKTPMFTYIGWLFVNVAAAYLLVGRWGVVGLAAASAIAFTLLSAVLLFLNYRALGGFDWRSLAASGVRAVAATAVMSIVILLIRSQLSGMVFLAVGTAVGVVTYLLASYLFGGREIASLIRVARS